MAEKKDSKAKADLDEAAAVAKGPGHSRVSEVEDPGKNPGADIRDADKSRPGKVSTEDRVRALEEAVFGNALQPEFSPDVTRDSDSADDEASKGVQERLRDTDARGGSDEDGKAKR